MHFDGPAGGASGSLRVLLAEDNQLNQAFLLCFLQNEGHCAALARDGREALELLARERFDLVLMDVQMPGIDGLEATRRIREGAVQNVPADIPIVALTAYAMPGDKERFLAAGMDGYISKPVSLTALQAEMARVLAERGAPGGTPPAVDIRSLVSECVYSDELVAQLFAAFAEEGRSCLVQLDTAGGDPSRLARIAHSLANSAGAIRAGRLLAAARDLEHAAKSGEPDLDAHVGRLAALLKDAIAYAVSWRA